MPKTKSKTSKINFTPFGKKCIVKRRVIDPISSGGIILTTTEEISTTDGTIVSVGAECEYAEIGHHVLFPQFTGSEIEIEDETYLIMAEENILGYYNK